MIATDVILAVNRMHTEGNSTAEAIHSLVTDYVIGKARSSLNKWQINAVVRAVLGSKTMVSHDDLQQVES